MQYKRSFLSLVYFDKKVIILQIYLKTLLNIDQRTVQNPESLTSNFRKNISLQFWQGECCAHFNDFSWNWILLFSTFKEEFQRIFFAQNYFSSVWEKISVSWELSPHHCSVGSLDILNFRTFLLLVLSWFDYF